MPTALRCSSCIWQIVRTQRLKRACRTLSTLTPEEAGRRAEAAAASRLEKESPTLATLVAHAGMVSQPNAPLSPPLHMASTNTRPADGVYNETDSKYSRVDNPTRLLLEKAIFEMECHGVDYDKELGPSTFCFSSGMMAVSSIILAHKSPVVMIFPKDLYHGVPTVTVDVFSQHNVVSKHVDMSDTSQIMSTLKSLEGTSSQAIVWMETPSNPLCHVIDIQGICEAVRSSKVAVTTVVDSTLAPPVITRPIEFGTDLVMHSGTKYLAGHSDTLLGVVTASPVTGRGREMAGLMRGVQIATGGVASSFDSWLTLRGLRTLQVRVERQCATALTIAEYLNQHNLVTAVHYPGLPSHPQHEVARRQMQLGFGGVLSFELADEVQATALAGGLKTIQRATSLGGTETLIEHRASIEPPERRTSPPGLLRLSVGLEDPKDLIQDLENALVITREVLQS